MTAWRRVAIAATAALIVMAGAFAAIGYRNARADPIVRRATLHLRDWPAGAAPMRVALIGDIHIGSPAMDAARLSRIADQVSALRPDLILIAGDFVFGHDPARGARYAARLAAPLSRLHAGSGVIAVLGNHDHWTAPAAVAAALRRAGVTLLANAATERGPLAIVGVDDGFSDHARPAVALAGAAHLRGARVLLSHSPDVLPMLPPAAASLVLTAHTHCGQVVVPWLGAIGRNSRTPGKPLYDPRYRCGIVRDRGRITVITGGLGTSVVPIRFGAPPDLWLLTLAA